MVQTPTTFYVAITGNDAWSGRLPAANGAATDGPFRTLPAAQLAVRRVKAALNRPAEIRVLLRGGVHELAQPWILTAEDSGLPRAGNIGLAQFTADQTRPWPVVWAAYPGEQPIISGGRQISGPWRRETVAGRVAWTTHLPEVAAGNWYFTQLWVNGCRRLRPRLPKTGFYKVEHALDSTFDKFFLQDGSTRMGFHSGDLQAAWRNLRDVELQFFAWWVAPRVGLAAVDEAQAIASFDRNSMMRLAWGKGDGVDYRVENVFEALTEPGQWYLDRPSGTLYYLPLPGEDMAHLEVIAPRLQSLLQIEGAAALRFDGLTLAHNEWLPPARFADSNQASWEVPAAVILRRTNDCSFHHCQVQHTNTYAVEIDQGGTATTLDHCQLRDLGAGGVRIWHGCRRNTVRDCEIADGGHVYPAGVGVLIGKSTGNRIEHNHIHDFYYTGISAGWTWGYDESDGYGNIIEWNHIHDLGKGLLSDMGGIYLLGHASGTRLRFNHVHDIACRRYGGWCIYTDEGSTDVLIESNLCYGADKNPFHQHYGRNNLVRHNIFAFGGDAVLAYSQPEPHLGLTFESNIFLSHGAPILRSAGAGRWTPDQVRFAGNLYWCDDGPVRFDRGSGDVYATQAFPNGFKAQAPEFCPLPAVPSVDGPPGDAHWQHALVLDRFVTRTGAASGSAGGVQLRLLRWGETLYIRGDFPRPARQAPPSAQLWAREHVELFLQPLGGGAPLVQLGLAADGETQVIWHQGPAPDHYDWQGSARATANGWQAHLRIPLDHLTAVGLAVGQSASGSCPPPVAWSYLIGFSLAPPEGDWSAWQALGHDLQGVVADPLFVAPAAGDFRLQPNSPALALGFLPFNAHAAGVRFPQAAAE